MRVCPHCEYLTDDDWETECPRCACFLHPPYLTEGAAVLPQVTTRRAFSLRFDPKEMARDLRAMFTYTPRELLRLGIVLAGSVLLVLGAVLPIVHVAGTGPYSLWRLADFLAVLQRVAALDGPAVLLTPVLGKAALAAVVLGIGAAAARWKPGIAAAATLAVAVTLIVIGGYYNLMRQVGPELERRLAAALQQSGTDIIHPYPAAVIFLILATALFQVADLRLLAQAPMRRKRR